MTLFCNIMMFKGSMYKLLLGVARLLPELLPLHSSFLQLQEHSG